LGKGSALGCGKREIKSRVCVWTALVFKRGMREMVIGVVLRHTVNCSQEGGKPVSRSTSGCRSMRREKERRGLADRERKERILTPSRSRAPQREREVVRANVNSIRAPWVSSVLHEEVRGSAMLWREGGTARRRNGRKPKTTVGARKDLTVWWGGTAPSSFVEVVDKLT